MHDVELTRILLEAGADPNDGESLYHAVESPECIRVLLEHGARPAGTNALGNAITLANLESLHLLLQHGANPNEVTAQGITPLFTVIRLRRSAVFAKALLDAGADPQARSADGQSAYRFALALGLIEIA